jgi:hypothetical protein
MHTIGGIILAVIAVLIFQTILVFIGKELVTIMNETANMYVIPMVMFSALQAFGVYAGIYFSALVTPKGNLKIVFVVVLIMLTIATVLKATSPNMSGFSPWFWLIFIYIVSCISGWIATYHGKTDRPS